MKSLITKRSQRIITIIIALVLLLNCSTFTSAKQVEPTKGQWEDKIEVDLREAMEAASDDEYIPVWLWRKNIDQAELNSLILEKTGYDPEIYEDISQFKEHILPGIEEEVRKNHDRDAGPIRQAANLAIGKNDPERVEASLVKEATRDIINKYICQRRQVSQEEYSRRNSEFLENVLAKRDDRKIIYCSEYTSTIIVEATKTEIEDLARDDTVESISLFVDYKCEPAMCDVLSQVGVYCEGGTGYEQPGLWSELTGLGVKIGVLEVSTTTPYYGGRFDETAPQLVYSDTYFINNTRNSGEIVPNNIDPHATEVVSIIAGQSVTYNGKTYRGVVPNASVYQVPVYYFSDILTGITVCLHYGVSIINMSLGGNPQRAYYYDFEREIDSIVENEKIVIVASAGNTADDGGDDAGIVLSPGRAHNVITVGSADTKTAQNVVLDSPYNISDYSSFYEDENEDEGRYCTNKPDVVAPGTVSYLKSLTFNQGVLLYASTNSGTSFAAPIVTGIAAQIIEYNPLYLQQPMYVKAAIVAGADLSQIDTTYDSPTSSFVYDKCGAGLVNAINSIDNISFDYLGEVSTSISTGNYYSWSAGDRVRAVLTFGKNNDSLISSLSDRDDLDLILVKRNTPLSDYDISYSLSYTNNNEIVDVTIPEDGEYYFIIYVRRIKNYSTPPTACVLFKHYPNNAGN